MAKLKPLKAPMVVRKLKRAGFVETHQRGSHLYLIKGNKIAGVPMHSNKDVPTGTLYNIVVHQAGLTVEEFSKL